MWSPPPLNVELPPIPLLRRRLRVVANIPPPFFMIFWRLGEHQNPRSTDCCFLVGNKQAGLTPNHRSWPFAPWCSQTFLVVSPWCGTQKGVHGGSIGVLSMKLNAQIQAKNRHRNRSVPETYTNPGPERSDRVDIVVR